MPKWLKYANRALAAVYLLGMALVLTSFIGETPRAEPATWQSAWMAVAVLAVAVFMGWRAGRESTAEQ